MIRFVIALSADRTVETKIEGETVNVVKPVGTILRSGYCSDHMFNRQALTGDEVAVEITAAQWPVDDSKFIVDLTGEEPVLIRNSND